MYLHLTLEDNLIFLGLETVTFGSKVRTKTS